MSYPYPQDRNRDRKEKGEQPYTDARQAMTENDASIQAEAEAFGEADLPRTDAERVEHLESAAPSLLRKVGADREHSPEHNAGATSGSS